MVTMSSIEVGSTAPPLDPPARTCCTWSPTRRPRWIFAGQLVAVVVTRAGWPTALSVLVGGVGVAVSWRYPWAGTRDHERRPPSPSAPPATTRCRCGCWPSSCCSPARCEGGSRWPQPRLVAGVLLASFMTVGGFRGGAAGRSGRAVLGRGGRCDRGGATQLPGPVVGAGGTGPGRHRSPASSRRPAG